MAEIATLKKINLRDVWQDEGQFSDWLAANLSRLGDELGMELEQSEREKAVGPFSADIVCVDQISKCDVVIENQFTRTDHDHLGKMITYASGLKASIVVWVAPRFRDEHCSAINWLNGISGSETGFFGIVLEALQIEDSDCAPYFKIVAKPNDWQRQTRRQSASSTSTALTKGELKMSAFWEDVRAFFNENQSELEPGNSRHGAWLLFKLGAPSNYVRVIFVDNATAWRVEAILYGRKHSPEYSRRWVDHLTANRDAIEEAAGESLIWDNPEQNVEMSVSYNSEKADIDDPASRAEVIARIYDKVHRLDRAFRPHIEAFVETHGTL